MDRTYDRLLGTALVIVGLLLLLYAFVQAYDYTLNPPTGTYNIVTGGGSGGGGNGSVNLTFNGKFLVTFLFLGIEYLVGAAILKAGWNLVTPKSETISVRVKPRSLQVESAYPSAPPSPPTPRTPGGLPPPG
jgi:hypothetical protein